MIQSETSKLSGLLRLKQELRCQHEQWAAPDYEIGDFSYGIPKVLTWNEGAKLKIGRFCSIADNVTIMLGGNHRTDWISTYPFNALIPEVYGDIKGHPSTDGDIVIGNDVWIARDAKIMSGITIGDGAVIAANAVVTHSVPPYTVVGGVPARVLKTRFKVYDVYRLRKMQWWNWSLSDIATAVPLIQSNDIDALWDYYRTMKKFEGQEVQE